MLIMLLWVAALGCSPAKMTDAQRQARATVEVDVDQNAATSLLSDFLLADGFSIERADESLGMISTNWKQRFNSAIDNAVGMKFEIRIQSKVRPAGVSSAIEFWIFTRATDTTNKSSDEELELDGPPYDELMARFRAYLADHRARP